MSFTETMKINPNTFELYIHPSKYMYLEIFVEVLICILMIEQVYKLIFNSFLFCIFENLQILHYTK